MEHDDSPIELVLMDWAGTITVPMSQMMAEAIAYLGWSDEEAGQAFGGLAEYFTSDDSIVHRAERGEVDDSELRSWLDDKYPGASALFDVDQPSFINASDRPEMIDLLWWLNDNDVDTWLATNNFVSAQDMLASRYLDPGLVSAIVNSSLVGVRKPDRAFWDLVLEAAELEPPAVLLVDDNAANVAAAADLGMATCLVGDDTDAAVSEIKRLVTRP